MDADRLRRIQELFLAATELPAAARRSFVATACAGDGDLEAAVLGMLEEDGRSGSVLDRDVAAVAGQVLDKPGATFQERPLGPYRLKKVLGEGGMGVVYLAEREDLGSFAAIKLLRDAWLSPARRERFAAEQRTLAQLNHPSIARLYDADTLEDGTPWFVMEYVEGVPITDYCREKKCSVQEQLRLFRAVCEAVRYAHEHAVIHRDLKPSNILVKPGGEIRLLDFGIAKQLESLDQPADQTRTELRLMTPAYAAPEQLLGEPVGIYTDVYALGVIIYELLTGRLPDPQPARPTTSPDLDVLCLTAIHKDKDRRYRSVEALIRDIDHYLRGEPLEARPDTLRYRLGKFIGRNRGAVLATGLGLAAVVALVVFFTVRLAMARNTAQATAVRLERVQHFMLNLFEGGDKSAAPAEGLKVTTVVDRGLREAEALQKEPEVQAELYFTLGGIYQRLGNLPKAESLLTRALAQRQSLFGAEHPAVAESMISLGLLRVDQARLDDAERMIRDGLEKTRRARPQNNEAIAKATTALGKVLEAKGAYDKAIPALEEAVRLESANSASSPELAAAIKELADAQFYAGHYDVCDALNQRALAMHRQLFGDRHPLVADDLINLGAVQFEHANYAEAEHYYRQALEINEAWNGKGHPETASTLSMLARALVFQHRYDEGVSLTEQALAIQERVYGPNHPRVANVVNELGTVALQRGNYDEAEARFRRMADIYRTVYGEGHYLYALANANIASVYLAQKDYARAEELFREVLRLYTQALSADHQYTGIAQIKLGRALVGEKRYEEAETHILAGYQILSKQTSPSASWLQSARKELVTIYEALNQPEKAAQFRKE